MKDIDDEGAINLTIAILDSARKDIINLSEGNQFYESAVNFFTKNPLYGILTMGRDGKEDLKILLDAKRRLKHECIR